MRERLSVRRDRHALGRLMQFTLYTDYALRVLIYLAQNDTALARTSEISRAFRISDNHLVKVVHRLARLGYVITVQGKGGGIKLARPPEQINLGEVVHHTEERLHLVECLADDYDGACRLVPCRLKGVLQKVQDDLLRQLGRYTIRDLIAKPAVSMPIRVHPR